MNVKDFALKWTEICNKAEEISRVKQASLDWWEKAAKERDVLLTDLLNDLDELDYGE